MGAANSATPADFPFGIVSLAGGTSEGNQVNMGAFRYAQSLNAGVLPKKAMQNTFIAQAFDAGDPCSGGNQCCTNKKDGQGGWPCDSGVAPYTGQFMGGIHPRVKRIVGERLAVAARKIAYKDETVVWTGPVLRTCQLKGNSITLSFDAELLKDDTIFVMQSTGEAPPMTALPPSSDPMGMLLLSAMLAPPSPLEVQINGTNFTDGTWVPVGLHASCSPDAKPKACKVSNTVSASLPSTWGPILKDVTAVRYAWGGVRMKSALTD